MSRWKLVCNTALRFSPINFVLHSGSLLISGWCPAKHNFIIIIDPNSGSIREIGSGIEGIMSRGIILHSAQIKYLL